MISRRDLLAMAGLATSGLATLRPDGLSILEGAWDFTDSNAGAEDEEYWAKVRSAFNVETTFLFLNYGGISPSPEVVRTAQAKWMRQANQAPSYYLFRKQDPMFDQIRIRVAKLFQCDPEEIAITPNASYGLFTTILGAPGGRGDNLLTTDQDYPRILTAFGQRDRREGTRTAYAPIPASPTDNESILTAFRAMLVDSPKLVTFPRIGFLNGTIFPAKEICELAHQKGAFTLVDGAHSIGILNDTPATLGTDAYACCLHKWVLGPAGSGFLYVKKDRIKDVWPLLPADESLNNNIRKFEQMGTKNTGTYLAILEALDAHDAIGTARKNARLSYLNRYWTDKVRNLPNVKLNTNMEPGMSQCLVNLDIAGIAPGALAGWLFTKKQIFVTNGVRGNISGIRVSPQVFNTPAELDTLVAAITEAATKGIG